MDSPDKYAVLVTGGSGCLGQHLIGLLQTRAPHVTEIRVLDVKPYENKLDYECYKPVRQFIGSINDRNLAEKACQGVSAVFHLACVVDYTMFPNVEKMELVNVQGTCTLLEVCKETGVKRFVYCSSMSVVLGYYHINGGTESSTHYPKVPIHNGYATTKQKAETIVIETNCSSLKTVAIRPVTFYGEEDVVVASMALKLAKKFGRWPMFDCKGAIHQMAYAGNVAWMFVCAEQALLKETYKSVGGNAYFAADDTPCADSYEIMMPFAIGCDIPVNKFKLPMWLILYPFCIIYFILWLLSPFMKTNMAMGLPGLKQLLYSYNFKYDKARALLDYTPLYSYEESLKRSVKFYGEYVNR